MSFVEAQYIVDEINHKLDTGELSVNVESLMIVTHAAIQCCGPIGQRFELTNPNTGKVIEFTLTTDDAFGTSGYREKRVYVSPGTWNCKTINDELGEQTLTIEATTVGAVYTFTYAMYQEITTISATSVYDAPDIGEYEFFITACGGGGGGSGGEWGGGSASSTYNAGGGGGGAAAVQYVRATDKEASTLGVTIGAGGAGGAYKADGKAGGSTVLTGLLAMTIPGGKGGVATSGAGGAAGGAGGGAGGTGGASNVKPAAGAKGLLGAGGAAGGTSQRFGGGGGGSIGAGGKGAGDEVNPGAGKQGGGGGGAYVNYGITSPGASYQKGGKGGAGVVKIYKGVRVE